jgi:hypothetical protein
MGGSWAEKGTSMMYFRTLYSYNEGTLGMMS